MVETTLRIRRKSAGEKQQKSMLKPGRGVFPSC